MANVLEQQNNSIDDYSNDDLDEGLDFDNTEIVVNVVVYSFIIKRRRRRQLDMFLNALDERNLRRRVSLCDLTTLYSDFNQLFFSVFLRMQS